MLPLDFFARRVHFVDHLAQIWRRLPADIRGTFYVPQHLVPYCARYGILATGITPVDSRLDRIKVWPPRDEANPVLCAAYNDLEQVYISTRLRPLILMEHGVGLSFPEHHDGYAGGGGYRDHVDLFLAPNEFIRAKTAQHSPDAPQAVIGTPKLDPWAGWLRKQPTNPPTVVVSFHWDGSGTVCPEAGNAFHHFRDALPDLARHFPLYGHGHPKFLGTKEEPLRLAREYERMGIPIIWDWDEAASMADIYVNDCSSTMYEFCCLDRPVVILNSPKFRRDKNFGIRFWDYTDAHHGNGIAIGPMCDHPDRLVATVYEAAACAEEFSPGRMRVMEDLFPYFGYAGSVAAMALTQWMEWREARVGAEKVVKR